MFSTLTERLEAAVRRMRGQAYLTEDNITDALREVRLALLEADVALPVVREFIEQVRADAIGREVSKSLAPGQLLVKVVHDRLVALMGGAAAPLEVNVPPPAVILLAGLQGSGKTTSAGKLARYLRERERKSVLLASADVYRPAAIEQLRLLAGQAGVLFFDPPAGAGAQDIARGALAEARRRVVDVLILDTAGRLHVDAEMMAEIRALHAIAHPAETLFVLDAMTGQDAVNTTRAFHEALALTGAILTKADGDARGGAALSLRHVTGAPIKFLGVSEKLDGLEPFHPERVASRILGMGDVVSLVEEVQRAVAPDAAQALQDKLRKGKGFDLEDFRAQLGTVRKMGGVGSLLERLPGMPALPVSGAGAVDERMIGRTEAIIGSMTPAERRRPDLINGSRKRRIAAGSGVQIQDVNRLLKQFAETQKMMRKLSQPGGMQKLMRGLGGMRVPPPAGRR
jgi:signal recognition particle subunit SRP54